VPILKAASARSLVAFYTDRGVLPRAVLFERFPALGRLSLHALSGAAWVQLLLFAVAGVAALALVAGAYTRLATVVSLVLLVSLHARNPVVLNAGDSLLRRLLLWSLFLPLARRWAVDRSSSEGHRVASVATAALLVQVVVVYLVNGLFKLRGDRWLAGDAVRYVFGLDGLTVLLGDVLARYPLVLGIADRLWLAMILGSWLLIMATGRARTALVCAFAAAHLGMALTMNLGLFPLVSVVALLPFLPPAAWDAVEARAAGVGDRPARFRRRPRDRFPTVPLAPVFETWRRLRPALVALLLAAVLVWNAATLGYVALPGDVTDSVDPGAYRWDMFAPEPRTVDGWYVAPALTASGERVDAYGGGPVEWDRPPDLAATYPDHRWYVYLLDLRRPAYADLRSAFAAYLCRAYAAQHPGRLRRVSVHFVAERVRIGAPDSVRRVRLVERSCPPGGS